MYIMIPAWSMLPENKLALSSMGISDVLIHLILKHQNVLALLSGQRR
jgi:hypothetical protein